MRISFFNPKEKETLTDNYDKTCHLLDLEWDHSGHIFIGTCSLCGAKNFVTNDRCRKCRAEIEG